jgi:rod shape-determining protein MreC
MESTQSFRFFNRGPSPMVRLVFFAVLSMLLLFVDARYRYLESTRSALSILVSPIQRVAAWPGLLWQELGDFYITQSRQHDLITENEQLHRQHQFDAAQLLQLQTLQAENQRLRNLVDLPLRNDFSTQMVEVSYSERDVFRRRLLVNKGKNSNIGIGQVVMDDVGIVGQVTRVYPWLSEVTLITEKDHAVPIQVLRNGLRAIVFGSGDTSRLSLRYMPVSSDVQADDILVTSGIDGTYPPGIPVAKVIKVERDPAYPFANVTCLPLAGVDNHRHLLVLSDIPGQPERPAQKSDQENVDKRAKTKRKN